MKELIATFPRQIACPERITCLTEKEFYEKISFYNGIKPKIYFALYKSNEFGSFKSKTWVTEIDKISFDLDSKSSVESAKRMSDWCLKENIRHCIVFSTGGLWIHILTKNFSSLKYPKTALKESQRFVAKEVGLTIGNEKSCDIDHHIIGDIARVSRMPGTLDTARGLYAQSIKREDLIDLDHLKTLAREQRLKIHWYGKEKFDISKFDKDVYIEPFDIPELGSFAIELEDSEKLVAKFPPCIIQILKKPEIATWRGRWLACLYLRERGFTPTMCDGVCREYFSKGKRTDDLVNNYNHFRKVKVLELVYGDQTLFFPKCELLYEEGWCPGKCEYYNKLYD